MLLLIIGGFSGTINRREPSIFGLGFRDWTVTTAVDKSIETYFHKDDLQNVQWSAYKIDG